MCNRLHNTVSYNNINNVNNNNNNVEATQKNKSSFNNYEECSAADTLQLQQVQLSC